MLPATASFRYFYSVPIETAKQGEEMNKSKNSKKKPKKLSFAPKHIIHPVIVTEPESPGDREQQMNELWLLHAIDRSNVPVAGRMLKKGANINTTQFDYLHRSPLMMAVCRGDTATVEFLLQHGADVNVQTDSGKTALMFAAENGYRDICKLLIRHGARIETRDFYGSNAFLLAKEYHHADVAELLKHPSAINPDRISSTLKL